MSSLQIRELNRIYEPLGFTFNLAGMTRTTNPTWWNVSPDDMATQQDMKTTLRHGSMSAADTAVLRIAHCSVRRRLTDSRGARV